MVEARSEYLIIQYLKAENFETIAMLIIIYLIRFLRWDMIMGQIQI